MPHSRPDEYCYLTTTGRRSGRPHRIEIWYAAVDDTLYLLAGGGRRADWVKNVSRDPAVEVEFAGAVVPARGRVLDGPDDAGEAESARALVYAKYAPRRAGREGVLSSGR